MKNSVHIKKLSAVLIWSEDYKALADWYKNILELPIIEELNHPEDTGFGFDVGGRYLWIGQHSNVHGKNKDMNRHMLNLEVDSVKDTYEELISRGVKFVTAPFKAPTFDKYFATFFDPDDNILQLYGDL